MYFLADGVMCPDGKNKRKVYISFICSKTERGPLLDAVSEECVYSFLWRTPAACIAKVFAELCELYHKLNLIFTFTA